MTVMTGTRPRLRSHVHVGLRVIHKQDRTIWRVANLWRADRQAQLVNRETGERKTVAWTVLYRDFECIQPFGDPR